MTTRNQYMHNTFSVKRNHDGAWKQLIKQALDFALAYYNSDALSAGRVLDHPELIYGYRRFHPFRGVQLKLNVKFTSQRLRGKQPKTRVSKNIDLEIPLGTTEMRQMNIKDDVVHLVMPLSGKIHELRRFLNQFESACGASEQCDLLIILHDSEDLDQTVDLIEHSSYQHLIKITRRDGPFSRAVALHKGMTTFSSDDLIWFIDVDIHFDASVVDRIRENTILNTQVYFPIVFSQYDSQMVCGSDSCPVNDQSSKAGSFRFFGFGIVSLYKSDYVKCGGFDLSIRGWGKEDVDLYTKVLKSGLTAYRAPDPGITHIYHPKICDSSLNADQTTMCLNSKATSFASQPVLASLYFNLTKELVL